VLCLVVVKKNERDMTKEMAETSKTEWVTENKK